MSTGHAQLVSREGMKETSRQLKMNISFSSYALPAARVADGEAERRVAPVASPPRRTVDRRRRLCGWD
jgi:hypothetical protein